MEKMNTSLISDDVVEIFEADGVVVLRDVFTPWVEGVRQAIEENKSVVSGYGHALFRGGRDTIILRPQERFGTIAAASRLR